MRKPWFRHGFEPHLSPNLALDGHQALAELRDGDVPVVRQDLEQGPAVPDVHLANEKLFETSLALKIDENR